MLREVVLRGIVFAIAGTAALCGLYLLSIGAGREAWSEGIGAFLGLLSGSGELSSARPGHGAAAIIVSGASVTLPLSLMALVFLGVAALAGSAWSASSSWLAESHGMRSQAAIAGMGRIASSLLSALPLFVGLWALYALLGNSGPFILPLAAAAVVALGGLGWDAARFLQDDMRANAGTTHAAVYATLGTPLGRAFPLPGTFTGYLLASSLPRFIPYLAGKVPAIIGSVTVAEIISPFRGWDRPSSKPSVPDTELLVASVFVLLCINASSPWSSRPSCSSSIRGGMKKPFDSSAPPALSILASPLLLPWLPARLLPGPAAGLIDPFRQLSMTLTAVLGLCLCAAVALGFLSVLWTGFGRAVKSAMDAIESVPAILIALFCYAPVAVFLASHARESAGAASLLIFILAAAATALPEALRAIAIPLNDLYHRKYSLSFRSYGFTRGGILSILMSSKDMRCAIRRAAAGILLKTLVLDTSFGFIVQLGYGSNGTPAHLSPGALIASTRASLMGQGDAFSFWLPVLPLAAMSTAFLLILGREAEAAA
jgi:hypothetical protein